ncbi:MAG: NYN domain-containing protein [Acidimicrobiales bacterium]
MARAATREAEAELAAARAAGPDVPGEAGDAVPSGPAAPSATAPGPAGDRELAAGVVEASRRRRAGRGARADRRAPGARTRARARGGAAGVDGERDLGPTGSAEPASAPTSTRPAARPLRGSAAADRHLVGDRANLLVVDGYNLARTAWQGLAPEEERRRTVELVEEVQARSGARATVVFDGRDEVVGPVASRRVQVRFSATGQTADDAIVALLDALSDDGPVVVVSSDRAVGRDVRARGASVLTSPAFLAAAGR